jgi:hypothetical protein
METLNIFLACSVASLDESYTKNEQDQLCKYDFFSKTLIFSVGRVLMIASTSEKSPKFI